MRALTVVLALALAGCGAREELEPPKGGSLPVAPYGAEETPTADNLLAPAIQARPKRSDDVLRQSEERKDDPFDLPPQN